MADEVTLEKSIQNACTGLPPDSTLPSEPRAAGRGSGPAISIPGYDILGELGKGGMGVVFKARHRMLNRIVAVKMIRACGRTDVEQVWRFRTETEAVALLRHPNIVQIYEVGENEGLPYCTLEYCPAGTLGGLLKGNPMLPREAARLTELLARAMAHAHQAGIIHRDLKPENVLLEVDTSAAASAGLNLTTRSGVCFACPKITDFGLAKKLDADVQHTRDGAIMGTPSYMAPEQAAGLESGPLADIYALGAILYELLTGQPPFRAATVFDTLNLVVSAEPVSLHRLQPSLARDLETICHKCLLKDPRKRYGSALLLADDLRSFLSGEPIKARPAGSLERLWKWGRRHPGLAATAAGFLCASLALGAAGFFAWQAQRSEANRQSQAEVHEQNLQQERRQRAIDQVLADARTGDFASAESAILQAELYGACAGELRMLRGQVAFHQGRTKEAITHLEQAIRLLPESVAARGMLAAAYSYDGRSDEMVRVLEELQSLTPESAEDFLFLGYAVANVDPARGLPSLDEAIKRRPSMSIARLLRAEVRTWLAGDKGDQAEAERAVREAEFAKEAFPGNAAAIWVSLHAQLTLAGIQGRQGQANKRQESLDRAGADAEALKKFPELPDAIVFRWLYFREIGREALLLDELKAATARFDHVSLTSYHAMTLFRLGDGPGAVALLEKRSDSEYLLLLPFIYAETAGQKRARAGFQLYLTTPHDGLSLMQSHSLLSLLGDQPGAIAAGQNLQKRQDLFGKLTRPGIKRCLEFQAGTCSAVDLVHAVAGSCWDQCLAHYLIAMSHLAEGNRPEAIKHFQIAVDTKAYLWTFHDLSWLFLARLEGNPNWPSWIPKRD